MAPTATDRYRAEFEAFTRPGVAGGPAWLQTLRQAAIDRFAALGFPTPRDEQWKYTSVAPIATTPFRPAGDGRDDGPDSEAIEPFVIGPPTWSRLVFVNGRYAAKRSSVPAPAGDVRVSSLAEALLTDPAVVERHLGRQAAWERDAFTALSTAFVQDGAFVHVPAGVRVAEPIHLLFVATSPAPAAALAQPRTLVVAGRESQVTVIESYVGVGDDTYFTNAVTEIAAGAGAIVDHYKLGQESPGAYHIGATRARLERDSTLSSCSIVLGGRLVRNDLGVLLDAEGAACTLTGLYLVGDRQHVDNHVTVDHARPRGRSTQLYKGVLDGRSRAVFDGKVLVRRDAQKTDAHQTNKHLLLSDGAEVDSKPQLEIFADDVKCAHGAAEGQLGEDALFYLKSRGLDDRTARALLTYGFAAEVLQRIAVAPVRTYLDGLLAARLGPDRTTKETS